MLTTSSRAIASTISRSALRNRSGLLICQSRIVGASSLSQITSPDMNFQRKQFCSLTKEEEEQEKERVSKLSPYQKEMELRNVDAEIKRLNTLRGINTGELYTWRGKFKALARDYGLGKFFYH